MSQALRHYHGRRGRGRFPLLELFERANLNPPEALDARELGDELGLPEAAVRGVLTYYADLREERKFTKVCQGMSCVLNGGNDVTRALRAQTTYGSLYCLGYCDRSPVVLRDGNQLLFGREIGRKPLPPPPGEVPAQQPPPPPIRCLSDEPIVTRRVGRGDFSELPAAREAGAYRVLEQVLAGSPGAVLDAVGRSGERGRGGAAFPTGRKWRRCAEEPADAHFVVANGDEGDPGSYIDRVLLEHDPHGVLEGLILCGYAVGAREGIVFVRSEYPWARERTGRAIQEARAAGILGPSVLGTDFGFEVTLFRGMGSYVCGEETAMLNAIEGLRGEVRLRPPYPAVEGLFGKPTVVNNVETLVNVPYILERGPEAYAALGTEASAGTKALCLNRGFARPGIVEVEFGVPLGTVIEELGGGAMDGRELEAVIVGGPMGSVVTPDEWDVPVCYGAMGERGIQLGHGGIVAVPAGTDWRAMLKHWLRFMQEESCGKCAPCSLGSRRALELATFPENDGARDRLEDLLRLVGDTSLCGFGRLIPKPLLRVLERFGDRIFDTAGTA